MIELRNMNSPEYANDRKSAVINDAEEKQRGEGLTESVAIKVAEESYGRLFTQERSTWDQARNDIKLWK